MASNFNVKITDNSKQFLSASKAAKQKALTKIGLQWDKNVVGLVPVDTGNLRNSRGYDVGENAVTVGFSANYAIFVETGTRRQAAQPFLKPSVENHIADYKKIVEDELKNA